MKNALLFLLFCLLPLEVFGRKEASSGQTALVFTHVTVIDATGAPAKPEVLPGFVIWDAHFLR